MRVFFRIAGVTIFAALSLFLMAFGVLYATVDDMLWFHAAAVPEAAREAVRPIYFALMTLVGAASGALGLLGLYVTAGPLRRGDRGAAIALGLANATAFIGAALVAERLAAATGAPTSWHIMGALLALTMAAVVTSLLANRPAQVQPKLA
ncbi:MAG: hypothetical protein ACKVS5_11875 [Parvularculaceae bacterium]